VLSFWTRYEDPGLEAQLPGELMLEVKGEASALNSAIAAYRQVVRGFTNMLTFVVNAPISTVDLHIGFDASPNTRQHEFIEVFRPDECSLPSQGRWINVQELEAFMHTAPSHKDWARIGRAVAHYTVALDNWFYGGETPALA
jgi:hypothetical protein